MARVGIDKVLCDLDAIQEDALRELEKLRNVILDDDGEDFDALKLRADGHIATLRELLEGLRP